MTMLMGPRQHLVLERWCPLRSIARACSNITARSVTICRHRYCRLPQRHRSTFQNGVNRLRATRLVVATFLVSSPLSNLSLTSPYVAFGMLLF
jgi:hypothetical protein